MTRSKLREIFAADFRDRVVHHLLVDYLEHIWEPIFIHDAYACRRALTLGALSVNSIESILKHGLDSKPVSEQEELALPVDHDNLRGSSYYQ